ncbi:Gryzun, putative trafficking through golgi-domain-containing protein [Gaertneriomyces semiglobifer]|nr:Gryzun, putative trafficking through golgi-domain-containing protein [Gaertneriomyces semiglobifer]
MESYPLEYVLHHVPLMGAIGLLEGEEDQVDLETDGQVQGGAWIEQLRQDLRAILLAKNNLSIWDAGNVKENPFFHSTILEKNHSFPAKKASRTTAGSPHSPLSPLTVGSSLHPDGIMGTEWVRRHKAERPAVIVWFNQLWERQVVPETTDRLDPLGAHNASGLVERERDLILCSQIDTKKRSFAERGIRFAMVLIIKSGRVAHPQVLERLAFIRRTCQLELGSSLFILSPNDTNITTFITGMQIALADLAYGYYRDHDKRIKRKKARLPPLHASAPPAQAMAPATSPLPPLGWHLRYEYKIAAFAEFRQDVETAIRHYETAYDLLTQLMHGAMSGGVLIPGGGGTGGSHWLQPFTSRWTDARTLADCISLKICKLYLYAGYPMPALQQLEKHIMQSKIYPEFVAAPSTEVTSTAPELLRLAANVTGGGSPGYWSWTSLQFRVFSELLELAASKKNIRLPYIPTGTMLSRHAGSNSVPMLVGHSGDATTTSTGLSGATNPSLVVQHAGYYYMISARCAEQRWRRFREANKSATVTAPPPPSASAESLRPGPLATTVPTFGAVSHVDDQAASLAAENTIDHATIVIELLTKAYEQFKKHKAGRMTLYLASEIARVYQQSGRHEMALKFFQRIGKTYRKEYWSSVLQDILQWSIHCAESLDRWDVVIESLVELMSDRMASLVEQSDREAVVRRLLTVLATPSPTTAQSLMVTLDMDQIDPFLHCSVEVKKMNAYVGTPAPLQITLSAPSHITPAIPVRLSKVFISFSNPQYDHMLHDHDDPSGFQTPGSSLELLDCTDAQSTIVNGRQVFTKAVDLSMKAGQTKVLECALVPAETGPDLKILSVSVTLMAGSGQLTFEYKISERPEDITKRRRWCARESDGLPRWTMLDGYGAQTSLRVIRKQPELKINLTHAPPGYLDEQYVVYVDVQNDEQDSVEAFMDVAFRNSGTDSIDMTSRVSIVGDDTTLGTENAIDTIPLGQIVPGEVVQRQLCLVCTNNPGERVLYVSVYSRSLRGSATSPVPSSATPASHPDLFFRKNETSRLQFSSPFDLQCSSHAEACVPFETTEAGLFAEADPDLRMKERYLVGVDLKLAGPWDLEVDDLRFDPRNVTRDSGPSVEISAIGSAAAQTSPKIWTPGHTFAQAYLVNITQDLESRVPSVQLGVMVVRWRRRAVSSTLLSDWTETTLSLPEVGISREPVNVLVDIPTSIHQTIPFSVTYNIYNTSLTVVNLIISMETTEGFAFSGIKHSNLRMLPLSKSVVTYNCVGLICGKVNAPRLKIVRPGDGGQSIEVTNIQITGGVQSEVASVGAPVFVRPRNGQLLNTA